MRRIELLIDQSRRATENVENDDTVGITDAEFIQYANDAQDQLQSQIGIFFPDVFQEESLINAVANQEEYDIPSDAFLGNRVDMVEYSPDGTQQGYYNVRKGSKRERFSGIYGMPSFYIRRSKKILLQPAPSQTGIIRVLYQKTMPRLDKRRGQVSAVSLTTNSITSLTLDTTQEIDDTAILETGYCSIVDSDGTVKMNGIPVTAVSTSSGAVTVDAGFTFDSGETIEVGDYIVSGKDASTHSQLPDICERYLIAYMTWKILKRDSSQDSSEQETELGAILSDIIASFREPDGDVNLIPIISGSFLTPEEF